MPSSYSTSFSLEKIATGEQSGTWGTTSNHNWDIVDRLTAYAAVALSGTTHTLTVREASPESGTENLQDGMYRVIKFTGALGAANTVTIAPNTTKAFFIIINATTDSGSSGPYSVILSQGSGANVTIANGKSSVVYCDGAGAGAAVTDALNDLQIGDDLSLASDSSVIKMGADDDITVTHVADVGLKLKQAGATGDDSPFILTLQTGELDIAGDDVLGKIAFQAPDEATGTDAILVAAAIQARSEGDFSSSSNATSIDFMTGSSEAAATKMSLKSDGTLNLNDNILQRANLLDYGEVTNAIGATGGGAQDIDLTLGNNVVATVDTSTNTFTFSNPTASDELCGFTLFLTDGGSQTVNWPAAVDWAGATAPTLTTSGLDILVFTTTDGGTIWHGMVASADSS